MERKRSVLLSGLGFYKLSAARRKVLTIVFAASLGAHVLGLLLFGGYIIMREQTETVTVFQTPPPVRHYEPRKLEHKVKVQQQQRSSSRPAVMPRLVAQAPSNLALPDLNIDPKRLQTTFQPKFKAVTGMGLGAGLGTGYGTSGFGMGMASVDFFGIRAKGEKIAILVDVSVSMVEEEHGGVEGFRRVRQRVEDVITALSDTVLFNVVVFADAAKTMSSELILANKENKERGKQFVRPYNTEGNWGLTSGNVQAINKGVPASGGTTRLDLAVTACYQMGADTVLIISDGAPRVRKPPSAADNNAWRERAASWQKANAGAIAAFNAAPVKEERVWVPPQPARAARPPSSGALKEGQEPDRGSPAEPAREGHWTVVMQRAGGGGPRGAGGTAGQLVDAGGLYHAHECAAQGYV